jgi:hypothetical protein
LIQANSVLRFTDISISLDGMGWRDNLLSFAIEALERAIAEAGVKA